jgi:hypothetical protein
LPSLSLLCPLPRGRTAQTQCSRALCPPTEPPIVAQLSEKPGAALRRPARARRTPGGIFERQMRIWSRTSSFRAPPPPAAARPGAAARQARSRRALRAPRTRRPGCRAAERERRQESGRANEWAGHSDLEPRAAAVQRAAAPRARLATGMHPRKASNKERGHGAARERPRRHADPGLPPLEKPGRRAQAPRTTQRARGRVYLPPLSARSIHAHPLCTEC